MSKEAMKLALEALEDLIPLCDPGFSVCYDVNKAITALREALAEQPAQQEPEYWLWACGQHIQVSLKKPEFPDAIPLYTSPPAQRKPLTDEEKWRMYEAGPDMPTTMAAVYMRGIADAEAAHNIKENT
jgi:hypothetical protein